MDLYHRSRYADCLKHWCYHSVNSDDKCLWETENALHIVKSTQSVDKDLTQLMTSWICGVPVQNLANVATEGTVEIFNNLHYN